jgi:hypothetical protein
LPFNEKVFSIEAINPVDHAADVLLNKLADLYRDDTKYDEGDMPTAVVALKERCDMVAEMCKEYKAEVVPTLRF